MGRSERRWELPDTSRTRRRADGPWPSHAHGPRLAPPGRRALKRLSTTWSPAARCRRQSGSGARQACRGLRGRRRGRKVTASSWLFRTNSQAFELTCAAVRSSVPVLNIVCVSFFAENPSSVYVPPPIRLAQPVEFVILCGIPQWGKRGHTLTSVYRERPSVAWMNTVRRE